MSKIMLSLQLENSSLKKEVRALKAEIGKLQTKNAKLETDNVSARLRIKALEKLKVLPKPEPLSNIEAARQIAFALSLGGIRFLDRDGKIIEGGRIVE